MNEQVPLTVGASVQMKVNLGNYESADAFLSIQNITADTTPEEMDAVIDQQRIAYEKLRVALKEKVRGMRADGQHPGVGGKRQGANVVIGAERGKGAGNWIAQEDGAAHFAQRDEGAPPGREMAGAQPEPSLVHRASSQAFRRRKVP